MNFEVIELTLATLLPKDLRREVAISVVNIRKEPTLTALTGVATFLESDLCKGTFMSGVVCGIAIAAASTQSEFIEAVNKRYSQMRAKEKNVSQQ